LKCIEVDFGSNSINLDGLLEHLTALEADYAAMKITSSDMKITIADLVKDRDDLCCRQLIESGRAKYFKLYGEVYFLAFPGDVRKYKYFNKVSFSLEERLEKTESWDHLL
jgi:hypothetical protein